MYLWSRMIDNHPDRGRHGETHGPFLRSNCIRRRSCFSIRTGFRNSCSQILITRHPRPLSARLTSSSRILLRANFSFQYLTFEDGLNLHCRQLCQKHPSTKTTTLDCENTKSGLPQRATPRRQPVTCHFLNSPARQASVVRFPRDLICDILYERWALVCTSATTTHS
jgi:hypothetical protein